MWEFWLEHNKRHQVSFLTWSFNVCQSGRKTCLLSKVVKVKQDIRACGWGLDSLLNKKGLSWNYTIAYWELYPTGNYYQIIFWIATIWQQCTVCCTGYTFHHRLGCVLHVHGISHHSHIQRICHNFCKWVSQMGSILLLGMNWFPLQFSAHGRVCLCFITTPLHLLHQRGARCSASVNGILFWGLEVKNFSMGKKRTFE